MMSDGPNGLRKQLGKADNLGLNESIETVCYPTSSATASSFTQIFLTELGGILEMSARWNILLCFWTRDQYETQPAVRKKL